MRIVGQTVIDRAPAEVFDYPADVRHAAAGHPAAVVRVEKVTDGPVGRGAVRAAPPVFSEHR